MVGASDGGGPKGKDKPLNAVAPSAPVGIPDLSDPSDEEGAETRVQAQPPNFAEIAKAFVPVGDEKSETAPKAVDAAKRLPADRAGDAYGSESVTKMGKASEAAYADDSVTADRPPVGRARPLPPGEDTQSVTQRARAGMSPPVSGDDDDSIGGRPTAIIMNPVEEARSPGNPPPRSVVHGMRRGGGLAAAHAELIEGVSDSGLRLSQEHAPSDPHALHVPISSSGDRLIVDMPISSGSIGTHPPRSDSFSGVNAGPPPSYGPTLAHAYPPVAAPPYGYRGPGAMPPDLAEQAGSGFMSRYDVRVIIVAVVSFAIPFGLFLYIYSLFDRAPNEPRRSPAEVPSEMAPATNSAADPRRR